MTRVDEIDLHGTTDAMVWAQEFSRIRSKVWAEQHRDIAADEETMLGWFANAIEVGRSAGQADPVSSLSRSKGESGG